MCTWNFVSSRLNKTKIFKVRKFNNVHNYGVEERMYTQRHATSDFIGYLIQDKYVDPKTVYTPADIRRDIKKIHGFDVNYMKAWRSKEKALEMVRGNPSKSYTELPNYLYMLMHTNPGSVYRLEKTDDGSFLYLFVAIYALIKGWEYCKPIVVVDGSFLKSTYRGTIITASAQDDAGKIFPLAYSIVDSENEASWEWFFERFRETYGVREGMCIVSDRHESIAKASSTVFPSVPHCVCIFHLWNNIKVKFKKNQLLMKDLFFAAAKAYTIEEFEHHMSEIDDLDKRVRPYLLKIGYDRWSIAHSTVNRTTTITSNIAESINAANKSARDLPICPLVEYMANLIRDWNYENNKTAMYTFTKLSEKYDDMLQKNMIKSHRMTVKPSSYSLYTVLEDGMRYVVDRTKEHAHAVDFRRMKCRAHMRWQL
ncbi:protein FAR1-RELATED SEQUENCE 4-like [Nicotiana sylvestris]